MRLENVLSRGNTDGLPIDSYTVLNSLDLGLGTITRVDMIVSVPAGGNAYANGKAGNGMSNGKFLTINADSGGNNNGPINPFTGSNAGCPGGSPCRNNYEITFVVGACTGDGCAVGSLVEVPMMEFTWYDFDMYWSEDKGRERAYFYDFQKYARSGTFVNGRRNAYVTTRREGDITDSKRNFIPYTSKGCLPPSGQDTYLTSTNPTTLPNFKVTGHPTGSYMYAQSDFLCPNKDSNGEHLGSSSVISVAPGDPYCYPPPPTRRMILRTEFRRPGTAKTLLMASPVTALMDRTFLKRMMGATLLDTIGRPLRARGRLL